MQVRGRGTLTIPTRLREKYAINDGDVMSLIDLGGVFVLALGASRIERAAAEFERLAAEDGVSVEELLEGIYEERRRGGRRARGT